MERTIIFISGWGVPRFLQTGSSVWDDDLWKDYGRVYLSSKTPFSDVSVKNHLDKLSLFVNSFSNPIVMGQSLGAWWAANLACLPNTKIDKLVLFTPFSSLIDYPTVFNVSPYYYLHNKKPYIKGPHKVLVCGANKDIITPIQNHASRLLSLFNGMPYSLSGGHFRQKNHKACLNFIKDWIEI